jgi:hypothetical protein
MALLPRQDPDLDDEPPLDPAAERIHQKMRGLLRMSGFIMGAGLLAVFSAILYRVVNSDGGRRAGPATEIAVPAPQGARLLAATPSGDRLALLVEEPDGSRAAVVVDLATGSVVARTRLVTGPAAP